MVNIQRILAILILLAGLMGCSFFKTPDYTKTPEEEILADVQTHAYAVVEAYKHSDFKSAREELETTKQILNRLNFESDAEKIDFLDRQFAPSEWGLTYAIIAEELDWREANVTASSAQNSKQSDPEELTAEEDDPEDRPVAIDDLSLYSDIEDRNESAAAAVIEPEFKTGSYFEEDLHNFIQSEIRKVAIDMGERGDFELPSDFVKEIEYYIRRFQNDPYYHDFFQRSLRRSRKYVPALRHYFIERGFPEEIVYLAFIESGFNPVAKSRANAVGMFQFIQSTGKNYGLKITRHTDERYSPIKSAIACREYLHDLLLELGSFTLALSSYNSGAGKTRAALRQLDDFKDRSFWALREKTSVLKHETREYIPQIFAAIVMAKAGNTSKFGFEDVPVPNASEYRMVTVPRQISLKRLANAGEVTVSEITRLNPDLDPAATVTPSNVLDYPLFVPVGSVEKIAAEIENYFAVQQRASIPRRKGVSSTASSTGPVNLKYRVQRGNTLSEIAVWFGTSVNQLKKWNPYLNKRGLRAGDMVELQGLDSGWTKVIHKVEPGDALSVIADRYGASMGNIKAWNGLADNNIIAGKTLVIYTRGNGKSGSGISPQLATTDNVADFNAENGIDKTRIIEEQKITAGESFVYLVNSGNTLGEIAVLFGVSVNRIKGWNNLGSNRIRVGQRLTIVARKNMKFYKYRVKEGDTLGDIALQFGARIETLKFVNGKNNSLVRVGEVLSIFSI